MQNGKIAKSALEEKDLEARGHFEDIQNRRGEYIQSEIACVFRAAGAYFAAMADACESGIVGSNEQSTSNSGKAPPNKSHDGTNGAKSPFEGNNLTQDPNSSGTRVAKSSGFPQRARLQDGESNKNVEKSISVGATVVGIHKFNPEEEDE